MRSSDILVSIGSGSLAKTSSPSPVGSLINMSSGGFELVGSRVLNSGKSRAVMFLFIACCAISPELRDGGTVVVGTASRSRDSEASYQPIL